MKKIFKPLIISFIATLAIQSSVAQTDTKATTILNTSGTKLKSYTTMKIEFTYTMVNEKTKVNESKSGVIQIKGDKYKLEMGGQTVFCDGKTVYTYIKSDNECNINNVSTTEDAMNPLTILNNYSKNFKAKYIKDIVQGGKTYHIVDLTPIKGKNYYKVRLTIDKITSHISSTVVYDKNGTTYTYTITKFTTNLIMADSIFTFVASNYPGVEINDMR